jgi:hypothetical protein
VLHSTVLRCHSLGVVSCLAPTPEARCLRHVTVVLCSEPESTQCGQWQCSSEHRHLLTSELSEVEVKKAQVRGQSQKGNEVEDSRAAKGEASR